MNRTAGVVRTHLQDTWGWIKLPWVILLSSLACNLIVAGLMDATLYTGGLASIYIYVCVLGAVCVNQSFSFAIGLGIRRKDYFAGTILTIGGLGVIYALALWLLAHAESHWLDNWGVGLHFFRIDYVGDGSALAQIWVNFSFMLTFFVVSFTIGCLHRRFGRVGIYTFLIALLFVGTIGPYLMTRYGKWVAVGDWLAASTAAELGAWFFLFTLLLGLLSYLMLRRTTA